MHWSFVLLLMMMHQLNHFVHSMLGSGFVSATGEVFQRAVNNFCIDHTCDEIDAFGNNTLEKMGYQTSWFSLLDNPSWSSPDLLQDVIRAIVNDLRCNFNSYALDHYMSQSVFVSQNNGTADAIDVVIKLENIEDGLAEVGTLAGHPISNQCSLEESNAAVDKPGGVPSSKEIFNVINSNIDIMRELCLIYIQVSLCVCSSIQYIDTRE